MLDRAFHLRKPVARLRCERLEARVVPADVSAPAFLQLFEATYRTIENRSADVFAAGYGSLWTPPPGRADSGNFSVGYDVYDRFDLGRPGAPTLYGTEAGLEAAVVAIHRIGGNYYLDFVMNHNGFRDLGTPGFATEGDYPGFVVTLTGDIDGDFHGAFESGDHNGRLAGLIDIAQEKNHRFIRSPVPGFANNIPGGDIADVPKESNRRFYPDLALPPIFLFDPMTGESNIEVHPFNNADPLAGDPVEENAMGLLMRNAQWLVQHVGVDGFRLDAAKHMPIFVHNFFDRAVYRSSLRPLLDGSTRHAFSFGEVFSGDRGFIQTHIRKDINPADPGRIGGNRDALDFPLFFAMRDNLTNNGITNDWRNIKNASQDVQDDGLANNGSQGVAFVSSHDDFGPYLGNVAYAYTLMRPGNAVVYMNAKEFGNGRDFPKDGRGDALGGLYGDRITTLVNLRNTHGRGNYIDRTPGADAKEMLVFEREDTALVVLSNRLDGGFDSRTIQTSFAPGTPLIELTGNAADPAVDPFNDFPELLVVNADGTVNLRVPRNSNPSGVEHGRGYFIYGPANPQGTLSLTNIDHTIPGQTPTDATNGTARLAPIDVITANTFEVRLNTNAVNLLGFFRDQPADGDNALLRLDGGLDVNGNGVVDFVNPGNVSYGFETFVTQHSPGFFNADGNGVYRQTINAAGLGEGMHHVTVRAFRHREPGEGEAIFTDFRRSIYIDRLDPLAAVQSFDPRVAGVNENRRLVAQSVDQTTDNMHVLFDLPKNLSEAQILGMLGAATQTSRLDRDLFGKDVDGLTHGNHVATVVSFEISGNFNIQRFPGLFTSTVFGAGLGDMDFDGDYDPADIGIFETVLESANDQFNPAGDHDGDGCIDNADLLLLYHRLIAVGASAETLAAYRDLLGPLAGGYATSEGNGVTLTLNRPVVDAPPLSFLWDIDNDGTFGDVTGSSPALTWTELIGFGIDDDGSYPLVVRVSDNVTTVELATTVVVTNTKPTYTPPAAQQVNETKLKEFALGSFSDPGADSPWLVTINWGDGTPLELFDATATGSLGTRPHRYQHDGLFQVQVTVDDRDGGTDTASFQITVKNVDVIVTGTDAGPVSRVRVYDANTKVLKLDFNPYADFPAYRGGVRVAAGDVNNDAIPDIVVAPGTGLQPHVRIFDGKTGGQLDSFLGYDAGSPQFTGGVYVAAGDVNGDGRVDLILGPGSVTSRIRVFHYPGATFAPANRTLFDQFDAWPTTSPIQGVRVGTGDIDGDGRRDILAGSGPGVAPRVRVFRYDAANARSQIENVLVYNNTFTQGIWVASADLDLDGKAEIVVSFGSTSDPPRVRIFNKKTGTWQFTEITTGSTSGQRIAAVDDGGDGKIVMARPPGLAAKVRRFNAKTRLLIDEVFSDPALNSGLFVGVNR
jgi:glycosidase